MTITHNYDLTGIDSRPTDEQINNFINQYEYVFPMVYDNVGLGTLQLYGSNSPMHLNYIKSDDTVTVTSDNNDAVRLAPNGNILSPFDITGISRRSFFTTKIGKPNTAGIYYTHTVSIGDQLTSPKPGWKRYDDTHVAIKYEGEWISITGSSWYGGSKHQNTTNISYDDKIKFSFFGTKLRIISTLHRQYSKSLGIKIDGAEQDLFSMYSDSDGIDQAIAYEIYDLTSGVHEVEIYKNEHGTSYPDMMLDAIDIDETGYLVIPIGSQLPNPEPGWKRYDNSHPAIKYEGSWVLHSQPGKAYGDSRMMAGSLTSKVSFKIKGTSFRWMAMAYSGVNSKSVSVKIDGIEEIVSMTQLSEATFQVLQYEKTGLSNDEHLIEMQNLDSGGNFYFDAIDIDADGKLLHPDEVTAPADIKVGKRIRAQYQSGSNTVGTFSNLGKETYIDGINDFIPPESSATPSGSFYYICVDEYNDKKILVADRNIQSVISWDSINSEGFVNGNTIDLGLEGYEFTVRLMSGGIDNQDFHNEWDQYIVNSSLNQNIEPGSNDAWNWDVSIRSWMSTSYENHPDKRVQRGGNSATNHIPSNNSSVLTNIASTVTGFRPLLEIESLQAPPIKKYLIEDEGEVKTLKDSEWTFLGQTATEELFLTEGMDSLDGLFTEKTSLVIPFIEEGELGEGKIKKAVVNRRDIVLKKGSVEQWRNR